MKRTAVELVDVAVDNRAPNRPLSVTRNEAAALDADVTALRARVALLEEEATEWEQMSARWLAEKRKMALDQKDMAMRIQELEAPRNPSALDLAEELVDAVKAHIAWDHYSNKERVRYARTALTHFDDRTKS